MSFRARRGGPGWAKPAFSRPLVRGPVRNFRLPARSRAFLHFWGSRSRQFESARPDSLSPPQCRIGLPRGSPIAQGFCASPGHPSRSRCTAPATHRGHAVRRGPVAGPLFSRGAPLGSAKLCGVDTLARRYQSSSRSSAWAMQLGAQADRAPSRSRSASEGPATRSARPAPSSVTRSSCPIGDHLDGHDRVMWSLRIATRSCGRG
jgi:hypothetical protein